MDSIITLVLRRLDTEDKAHKASLIDKSALGALHQPGERVTWISACGYGPYTSIVLGSEQQSTGIGYWCETAPESVDKPTHLAARYWVYQQEIDQVKEQA